ncbi:MAG TPA: ferredoxin family protein, partial [Deltaproteobacteria bacterium]|nr:ferredoxin family protein [Deltaproteobacteria bacterium]
GVNMLVINPDECIDCGACVPECPADAIFLDEDLPPKWGEYEALNASLADQWPVLTLQRDPLPGADAALAEASKRAALSLQPGAGD